MKRIGIAAACLAVFAVLCYDAATRLADAYPNYEECTFDPIRHSGKPVWINATPVVKSTPEWFAVIHYGQWVQVRSSMEPEVGAWVMTYGTFQPDKSVLAIATEEEKHFKLRRRGVMVVSVIVLAIGMYFFHRRFEWRGWAIRPREVPHG